MQEPIDSKWEMWEKPILNCLGGGSAFSWIQ